MYDYKKLTDDLIEINSPSVRIFSIGKSAMGKDIPCIRIGQGQRSIILNGAHHGLEYITSAFLMKFASEYIGCIDQNKPFCDIFPYDILDKVSIYIIPMVNPDGVDIAINGLDITNPHHRKLISNVGIHSFNNVWQANANGVDLNHNYNAGWRMTVPTPGPTRYAGEEPEDQPETQAMANFIRKVNSDMILCFHSQGKEIYYDYDGKMHERALEIARKMQFASGYTPTTPKGCAAYGGCKDWFIDEFNRPGFTIEIGSGKNPLPMDELEKIYDENSVIVLIAIKELLILDEC